MTFNLVKNLLTQYRLRLQFLNMRMKKILFSLLFIWIIVIQPSFGQNDPTKILIQEYIHQSEKQKKTGVIMLGAGLGSTILGAVMVGTAWGGGSEFVGGAGVVLLTAGSISTLVSIPILVSSASNGRKAGKLSLGIGEVVQSRANIPGIAKPYPALNFSLPLNSKNP